MLGLLFVFYGNAIASQVDNLKERGWIVSMKMYEDRTALTRAREFFLNAQKQNPDDASIYY